ncbi:MAG TPA: hypothetical protein EYG54_04780 [Myxococcales bacterium]|nr:hypothetical protein [Myxococcales bacterium]
MNSSTDAMAASNPASVAPSASAFATGTGERGRKWRGEDEVEEEAKRGSKKRESKKGAKGGVRKDSMRRASQNPTDHS